MNCIQNCSRSRYNGTGACTSKQGSDFTEITAFVEELNESLSVGCKYFTNSLMNEGHPVSQFIVRDNIFIDHDYLRLQVIAPLQYKFRVSLIKHFEVVDELMVYLKNHIFF